MKTYIFQLLTIAAFLLNGFLLGQTNPNHVWVNGYTKSNGTYVEGHYRTAPNSTNRDNFSTVGNTNPYTGKPGWIPADNNPMPTSNNSSYSGTSTYTYNTTTTDYSNFDFSKYYDNISNSSNRKSEHYSGIAPSSSVTNYTTTSLRLRGGPGTDEEIVLTMPQGAAVEVVNDLQSWAYVYYNGYYGYAASSYLSTTRYAPNSKQQPLRIIVPPSQISNYSNVNNQSMNSTNSSGYSAAKSSSNDNGGPILLGVIVIGLFFWWLKS